MKTTYTVFIIVFLSVITIAAYGQISSHNNATSSESAKYIYCELIQQDYLFSGGGRTEVFLKFGSQSKYPNRSEESSYVKSQADGLDALNYMTEKEWEPAFKNSREFGTSGIETVYLLRKIVR